MFKIKSLLSLLLQKTDYKKLCWIKNFWNKEFQCNLTFLLLIDCWLKTFKTFQNLDDMDDVEEGKKELITREITQFREQMKVRNTDRLFTSSEAISWAGTIFHLMIWIFSLFIHLNCWFWPVYIFYYFFLYHYCFHNPLFKRVHIYTIVIQYKL